MRRTLQRVLTSFVVALFFWGAPSLFASTAHEGTGDISKASPASEKEQGDSQDRIRLEGTKDQEPDVNPPGFFPVVDPQG